MHCIHCGKETRNNVVFCTNCGRPTKREYSHYACEIYDAIPPLREKWHSLWACLSVEKDGDQHSRSWHSSTTEQTGLEKFLGVNKQKLQEVYRDYFDQRGGTKKSVSAKGREQKNVSLSTVQKRTSSPEKQETGTLSKKIWIVLLIVSAIIKILAAL